MSNLQFVTPLKGEPKQKSFLAFDIEGVGGPNGFWHGATYGDSGPETFRDPLAMWRYLLSAEHGQAWRVAHNLEYDLSVLNLEALLTSGAVMGSSGLLWYDTLDSQSNPIRFIDSLNLFRGLPLKDVAPMVGLFKGELDPGYFALLRAGWKLESLTPQEQSTFIQYNVRDAEIVYRGLMFLQDMINALGGELRETIAGTSHDLYRRVYMTGVFPIVGPNTNEAARGAFYGGRVEPYRMKEVQHVNMYDVNSLYPYIMQIEKFPYPGSLDLDVPAQGPTDLDRREGVACVDVVVPDTFIPPLPCRVDNALFFPCGKWKGTYTLQELRHALNCGVQVTRWHWMISTRRTFNPFAEFVTDLWNKRNEYVISNPSGDKVVKMILNSYIGRYGVKPWPPLTTLEIVKDKFDPERDQGLLWSQIGRYDYVERPLFDGRAPTYANVFFAAQVAAGARVFLHQEMLKHGNDLVYVDTDAIMTTRRMKAERGLGKWKNVLRDGTANMISPKEYSVLVEQDQYINHVKGVPPALAAEYLKVNKVRWDQALTLRSARINGRWPGSWVEVVRSQGNPTPKRPAIVDGPEEATYYSTEPWSFEGLQAEMNSHHRVKSWS